MKTLINLSKENKIAVKKLDYILVYTASVISVFCAFLIIVELKGFLNPFMFYTSAFILLFFLVCNELMKITESRKSKATPKLIFSFFVTFSLSITGIFLWTNKSFEDNIKFDKETSSVSFNIENKYNHLIDSINNTQYKNTDQYTIPSEQIADLSNKRKHSRDSIRQIIDGQISSLRTTINNNQIAFEKDKKESVNRQISLKKAELNSCNTNINSDRKTTAKFNF